LTEKDGVYESYERCPIVLANLGAPTAWENRLKPNRTRQKEEANIPLPKGQGKKNSPQLMLRGKEITKDQRRRKTPQTINRNVLTQEQISTNRKQDPSAKRRKNARELDAKNQKRMQRFGKRNTGIQKSGNTR